MSTPDRAFAPAGTSLACLLRLEPEEMQRPLSPDLKAKLARLRPFPGWEARMRELLRIESQSVGEANPAGWSEATAGQHLRSLYYILATCDAAGACTTSFADLLTTVARDALRDRLRIVGGVEPGGACGRDVNSASNESSLGRTWGPIYLASLLASLRTLAGVAGLEAPSWLKQDIARCGQSKFRKDVRARVLSKDAFLAGAAALDAFARVAAAAGYLNTAQRCEIGARILAVATESSPRRGELSRVERHRVMRHAIRLGERCIYVRADTSKARVARTLAVTHPVALRMLEKLLDGPGGSELFRYRNGKPIPVSTFGDRLRSASLLAVGVPASFNVLRKTNAAEADNGAVRSARLGHSPTSVLAETIYHPDLGRTGRQALAMARSRAVQQALSIVGHGLLTAASTISHPVTSIGANEPERLTSRSSYASSGRLLQ